MRSLLFVPADSERKIEKALASNADAIIMDLEDSVSPANKPAARVMAHDALMANKKQASRLIVRINPLNSPFCKDDLDAILPATPAMIMQPKTDSGQDVARLISMLGGEVQSVPRIIAIATETAASMFSLGTYDCAHPHLLAMAWGAEDLSNDLGATANRDEAGRFLQPYELARTLCLAGARAAGVEPIDTVFVNFRDEVGLEQECIEAARDGFTGKMAIHPAQVDVINRIFTPSAEDVEKAKRIVEAFTATPELGVIGIDGEMIDRPHLKRAEKLLERAKQYGN